MKTFLMLFLLTGQILCMNLNINAQTGPGGIGNVSNLSLWLRAEDITGLSNGDAVSTWTDRSGNGLNATQSNNGRRPVYVASSSINNRPAVSFDGNNDNLYVNDNDVLDNTSGLSFFAVVRPQNLNGSAARGLIGKRDKWNVPANYAYELFFYTSDKLYVDIEDLNDRAASSSTFSNNTNYLIGTIYDGSQAAANRIKVYKNGTLDATLSESSSSVSNSNQNLYIGDMNLNENKCLQMQLAELIIYRKALTPAERIVVENYLAAKYGLSIATDLYAYESTHPWDVSGIYKISGSDYVETAQGASIVKISNPSNFGNGEALFWGHDNASMSSQNTTDVPAGINNRLNRVWRVSETGDVGNVTISIDISAFNIASPDDIELLIDNDGTFANASRHTTGRTFSDGIITFTGVDFSNGAFFTIGSTSSASTLPVELSYFTVDLHEQDAVLTWKTESEHNNDRFEVYRSNNGLDFDYIARVKGAGTTNKPKLYKAIDPNLPDGTFYYRLKQIDFDGKYEYSDVLTLNKHNAGADCEFTIKPNPCIGSCLIDFENCESEDMKEVGFNVYDIAGNVVYTSVNKTLTNGEASFLFDAANTLKPAVYFIRGGTDNVVKDKKIIINKQ